MGSFERFKMKTHFNLLKWLVGVTALAALALKLLTIALATAAGDGTPVDLLARVPASVADLGAALLVFEVLRPRRPLQLAARSVILVAVSPVLFVASGIHGDRVAMAAVAAGAGGHAADGRATRSRVVHFGGALAGAPFAAWVPAVVWVRRRPRRVYAAVGLVLLTPLALGPAWSPRDLVWPAVFGYLGDAGWASIYAVAAGATLLWTSTWWGSGVPGTAGSTRRPCRPGRWPVSAWSPGWC